MAFNPTEAQRKAVEAKGVSVLLSAAAGSGKTATLTNRIITSLTDPKDPADLSKMLVVTFSRAAAAELKERISKALSDALAENPTDPHLNRQTIVIGSAKICTIDAFCLDVVRSNFQRVSFSDGSPMLPDFRLADDAELNTLRLSVMNSTIDDWYDRNSSSLDFPRLVEKLSNLRGEGDLLNILLGYASFVDALPSPDEFTKQIAEGLKNGNSNEFFSNRFGAVMRNFVVEQIEYYKNIMTDAVHEFSDGTVAEKNYLPAFKADLDFCNGLLNALNTSYSKARAVFDAYSGVSLKSLGKRNDEHAVLFKNFRNEFKKQIKAIQSNYFLFLPEDLARLTEKTANDLLALGEFISDYRKNLLKEKLSRHILEFSDVTRLAHSLLVEPDGSPSSCALDMRDQFNAVYIDEYQDVNKIQDEIFNAISRPGCRFMVGDIKQSIYAFRGAEPSIFGAMRKAMPAYGSEEALELLACSIFMSDNFRCDKTIIDFVNLVSKNTFVPTGGMVDYRKDDDLNPGKTPSGEEPVNVVLLSANNADEVEEQEASYIASEIKRLISSEKKNDGTPIIPSDIAVLSRNNVFSSAVSAALSTLGIDSANISDSDFFAYPEILLVLSLITAIDNPQKDIPLTATLYSPFFDFTMDDLVEIRQSADKSYSLYEAMEALAEQDQSVALNKKCAEFIDRFESLRSDAIGSKVDRFLNRLYGEFGIMSLTVPDDPRPSAKISANLRRFYEYARDFSSHQFGGLSAFVSFVNGIIESESRVESPGVTALDGAVSIMTIHKSKGLEFPVVFVANCGKSFNRKSLEKPLQAESDIGVALPQSDESGISVIDTPLRKTIIMKKKQTRNEEEIRLLYVALTRARERLYVVGCVKPTNDVDDLLANARFLKPYQCRASVLDASCYLDWIIPSVCQKQDCFTIVTGASGEKEILSDNTAENNDKRSQNLSELRRTLRERFDFKYSDSAALTLPAKLSVSKLYPDILDDDGVSGLTSGSLPELREKPLFMQEDVNSRSAAERGTATHAFLQFCDFELASKDLRQELARLVAERFIPRGFAEMVDLRQLDKFFKSSFYSSLTRAKKVWREQRFNLLLPATDFTSDPELAKGLVGRDILVQGVIDLFFVDANQNVVLCDYKTDYLTPAELSDEKAAQKKLSERHGQQLKYYSAAIEKLLGKAPDRVCIYSLPFGKAIDVIF